MNKTSYLNLFLILLVLNIAILAADVTGFLKFPKTLIYYITNPISLGFYKSFQNITDKFYFIFYSQKLYEENKTLEESLLETIAENAILIKKLTETQELLSQEYSLDPQIYKLVAAHPKGLDRYLKIDKGSNDGIKIGFPAVLKDNYIGKVIAVSEKGSTILLVSDPDSRLSAFSINKEGRAKGVILGEFGQEMLFDKILHDEQIEIGDLVYSEGLEGFLPRGLVLGKVTEVIKDDNAVFKQAKVKPVFKFLDLDLVFVILEE